MTDRGRIVVVAAGFGVWRGGKCLAAGKWSDIARIRAYAVTVGSSHTVCAAIELRDGSEVEVRSEAPGWMSFVNAAPTKLPGMPQPDAWLPQLASAAPSADSQILFERSGRAF
jgi:hypothetical protein